MMMDPMKDAQTILRERARALAVPVEEKALPEGAFTAAVFALGSSVYAVDARHVAEVLPFGSLTPLPCVPEFVLGLVNLRGSLVPVIDLKRFFGRPEDRNQEPQAVLVLVGECMVGIAADAVLEARSIVEAGLDETPEQSCHIKGVTTGGVAVLDAAGILQDARLFVSEEI